MGEHKRRGFAHVSDQIGAHVSRGELLERLEGDDPLISMTSFAGLELSGAPARNATLEELVFRDCVFEEVDFSQSSLTDVRFTGCRFIGCTFERCWLNRVDFQDCAPARQRFPRPPGTGRRSRRLSLRAVILRGRSSFARRWRASTYRHATLRGSRFRATSTSSAAVSSTASRLSTSWACSACASLSRGLSGCRLVALMWLRPTAHLRLVA